jgi:oxygen-dependent protoporphyrinogen oxidase
MTQSVDVVVVGGGITGLAAADALRRARPELELVLLEERARLGGNIVTEKQDGFLLDGGPDSFLSTKPQGIELCNALGLEAELIRPRSEARKVYMLHEGALEPMPAGLALAIPTRVGPMLKTPLLGLGGKLRILGDLVLPRGHHEDESIAEFLGRRFGDQAVERLAGPLLGGIYAGDIGELSIRSTFPQLVELLERRGSLIRGFLDMTKGRNGEAPSPFVSLERGMGRLIDALAESLPSGSARTGRKVERIEPAGERLSVILDHDERIDARAVVLATPAHVAARVIPDDAASRELGEIPYLSTATVFFALDQDKVRHSLDATGFVARKGEARIIASTWVSSKWSHRAPDGRVLLRAFLGGARAKVDVKRASDEDLVTIAREELERVMGPLGPASFTRVFRYIDANPQPVVGHAARIERVRGRLKELRGLYLAGAAYDGVGIPDCIRQARAAVEQLLRERFAS